MGKKLRIDGDTIQWALNSGPDEIEWFLDLETGEVIPWEDAGITDIAEQVDDPHEDAERYQPIEPLSSPQAWSIRADFVETVRDSGLRARLRDALDGKGAFRRFKHELGADREEEQRWFAFEEERLLAAAREQLHEDGIEAEFVRRR
ncbi:MAG: UPF0158 family protein [Halofilum sp. (in: g-proteobacteria)]|nr:UPF0158 family protein [Halofilum sp. (in: g-proteobacteria)]